MSDTLREQLGPAAQNVEQRMGGLVDMAIGTDDGSGAGTIAAATGGGGTAMSFGTPSSGGGGCDCRGPCHHDGETLHRDTRTGEYVTSQIEHVERGAGAQDKRGSASRFLGDY